MRHVSLVAVHTHTHTHTDNLRNNKVNKDSSIMPIYIG